jgi:hypothetical protein
LVNSLRDEGYEAKAAADAVAAMALIPAVRAEALTLEQFVELARRLARRTIS